MERSGSLNISVVSSLKDFESIEPAWNSLLKRSNVDNPFLTFEWQYTWWEMFGKGKKLYIVVAKIDDQIVGIGPFMVSRFSVFKILEFIGTGLSDYLGIIWEKDQAQVVNDILHFLLKRKGDWNVINLRDIADIGPVEKGFSRDGISLDMRLYERCPYVEINQFWPDYIKGKGSNFNKHMKYNLSKIDKLGNVELIYCDGRSDSGDKLAQTVWEIEKESWKQSAGTAHFANEGRRGFLGRIIDKFAARDWMDAILLRINGEIVAYSIGFKYNSKAYNYEVGYKESCPGAGTYLTWNHIKKAFEKGFGEFDFLRGDESYKLRWTKEHHDVYQLVVYKQKSFTSLLGFLLLFKFRWKISKYETLRRLILKEKEVKRKILNFLGE